jgi:hypothetical protein
MNDYQTAFAVYLFASFLSILVLFLTLRGLYFIVRAAICLFVLAVAITIFPVTDSVQAPNVVAIGIELTGKNIDGAKEYLTDIIALFVKFLIFYAVYLLGLLAYKLARSRLFAFIGGLKNREVVEEPTYQQREATLTIEEEYTEPLHEVKPDDKEQQVLDVIFDSVLDKNLINDKK